MLAPFSVYAAFSWLPRRKPHLVRLPHRDHWFAPARREASLAALRLFGVALALAIVALLVTVHFLILDAHTRTPPRSMDTDMTTNLNPLLVELLTEETQVIEAYLGRAASDHDGDEDGYGPHSKNVDDDQRDAAKCGGRGEYPDERRHQQQHDHDRKHDRQIPKALAIGLLASQVSPPSVRGRGQRLRHSKRVW